MRISLDFIKSLRDSEGTPPCSFHVELFKKFLGTRKYILDPPRNLTHACKAGLDVFWFFRATFYTGVFTHSNGTQYWYLNGQLHRTDGPALVYPDGQQEWYLNGQLHRTDGPAITYPDGQQEWYLNGQLHRTDGPEEWYLNGQLHRTYSNGTQHWYLNGQRVPPSNLPLPHQPFLTNPI